MASITEVQIRLGRTMSHGHYESTRVDVTLKAQLDKTDDPDLVFEQVYEQARQKLIQKMEILLS